MSVPRPEFAPDYWLVRFRLEFHAAAVRCPKNPYLRRTRARKFRRVCEHILSALLSDIESITRFPAYFHDPRAKVRPGDGTPFSDPWEITIESYSLGPSRAKQAAALVLPLGLSGAPLYISAEVEQR
jgi:hypothetical protein